MPKTTPILSKKLKVYFEANPHSLLLKIKNKYVISRPWDDPTITINVSARNNKLIDTLNNVILPPRFTCIWHVDTKDIEIIFTALPIPQSLRERSFAFTMKEKNYKCEFGKSSDRLLLLAEYSNPTEAPSDTNFRNLFDYYIYLHYCKEHPDSEEAKKGIPTSFWIRNVDFDEGIILNLFRHLNFFMRYFDPHSPQIIIHDTDLTEKSNYVNPFKSPDIFPKTIFGRTIDQTLLALWENAISVNDSFRKYLYKYQIIEYCAFYHLQDDILRQLKKVASMPNLIDNIDDAARSILEVLTEDRMEENTKIIAVLERFVDPKKLWDVIHPNAKYFSSSVEFDGGIKIDPIITERWGFDDFKPSWSPKLPNALRTIRNGLVHARERRMAKHIAPTQRNRELLRPWLAPLMIASMELLIYGD